MCSRLNLTDQPLSDESAKLFDCLKFVRKEGDDSSVEWVLDSSSSRKMQPAFAMRCIAFNQLVNEIAE